MKILFLDTETGGLNFEKHSLLTIGACVWENGDIIDEIELLISELNYCVNKSSMLINQIDLQELQKKGISEKQALQELEMFCEKHFGEERIILGGHNISFDIDFLRVYYKKFKLNFEKRYSHKKIDTVTILYFLYLNGIIQEQYLSLDKFIKKYNIESNERHTALADAKISTKIFNQSLELIKKRS